MAVHRIAAIKHSTTILSAFGRVQNPRDWFRQGPGDSTYDTLVAVNRYRPTANVSLYDLSAALSLCGVAGLTLSATPLELWTLAGSDGSKLDTTGEQISINKGIMLPGQVSLSSGQPATISYVVGMGSSAGTAPYSVSSAQTIGDVSDPDIFTLGDVTINSVDVGPVQSVTIDFGWTYRQIFGSEPWPEFCYAPEAKPEIRIETLNDSALADFDSEDTNVVSVTADKLEAGAGRATIGNKVFTTTARVTAAENLSGQNRGEATTTLRCIPYSDDGSNTPIVVS